MNPADGPRWLDVLARRAVRDEVAPRAEIASGPPTAERGGLSRRALLQTAGGAALLWGPLRLLAPAPAAAQDPNCVARVNRTNVNNLVDCVRQPMSAFRANRRGIRLALKALRNERNPTQRRRLLAGIDRATVDMGRVVHRTERCNFDYIARHAAARDACHRDPNAGVAPPGPNPLPPPPPPPPGGGGGGSDACLNCQSVGGKCCMSGADLCACANPDVPCSRYGC